MRKFFLLPVAILSLTAFFQVFAEDKPSIPPAEEITITAPESITIGQALADDSDFDTFSGLLKLAGMDSLLAEKDAPYTLFVPTNSAFADINNKLDDLKKSANKDKLVDLLNHHIVNGMVKRSDLAGNTSEVLTSTLKRLRVVGMEDTLSVNGIKVEDKEISSNNAIIYKIGAVIESEAERPSMEANPVEEAQIAAPDDAIKPAYPEKKPWYRFW